jgi:hypothetical protein
MPDFVVIWPWHGKAVLSVGVSLLTIIKIPRTIFFYGLLRRLSWTLELLAVQSVRHTSQSLRGQLLQHQKQP